MVTGITLVTVTNIASAHLHCPAIKPKATKQAVLCLYNTQGLITT